ncbi:MAG: XisH family protein [Acidobacteria bacterium]|nr:XisH family protein [Acidobacteriota bacterium]
MPAKDIYHDTVIAALTVDGWTITDDPLQLRYKKRDLYVDLAAERSPVAAEKEGRRIAVEIKSFLNKSQVEALQEALGQFLMYREILAEIEAERILYLAVPKHIYEGILSEPLGRLMIDRSQLRLLVFSAKEERILKWIN